MSGVFTSFPSHLPPPPLSFLTHISALPSTSPLLPSPFSPLHSPLQCVTAMTTHRSVSSMHQCMRLRAESVGESVSTACTTLQGGSVSSVHRSTILTPPKGKLISMSALVSCMCWCICIRMCIHVCTSVCDVCVCVCVCVFAYICTYVLCM